MTTQTEVTDRKVLLNDGARPWKVIVNGTIIGRYATEKQAKRRATKAIAKARGQS